MSLHRFSSRTYVLKLNNKLHKKQMRTSAGYKFVVYDIHTYLNGFFLKENRMENSLKQNGMIYVEVLYN